MNELSASQFFVSLLYRRTVNRHTNSNRSVKTKKAILDGKKRRVETDKKRKMNKKQHQQQRN